MSGDLLARLAQAQSDDERTWLVTESVLEGLPVDVRDAVWAVAVPHWFDAEILAALKPELTDRAASIYEQLQQLSFVEVFPDRGHNIHERTRNTLLEKMWEKNTDNFKAFSQKAYDYFSSSQISSLEDQFESLYHRIVVDPEKGADQFSYIGADLNNSFRNDELEALTARLLEQVDAHRARGRICAMLYWRKGKQYQYQYNSKQALILLDKALKEETDDTQIQADILQTLGDTFQFLNRNDEALTNYKQAITLYRDIGDRVGEANILYEIGSVLQFLKRNDEALTNYEQAMTLYQGVGSRLGEANTLQAIGDVLQFLKRNDEALTNYEQAMTLYKDIGDQLGEANILYKIGNVLQFLKRNDEALANYEQVMTIYREVGDRVGQANILYETGNVFQFLKRNDEALANYDRAMKIYQEIGAREGEANALRGLGSLEAAAKALTNYQAAQEIYISIGDRYNQGKNLCMFMADAYVKLNRLDDAFSSVQAAIDIAEEIGVDHLKEDALEKMQSIQNDTE